MINRDESLLSLSRQGILALGCYCGKTKGSKVVANRYQSTKKASALPFPSAFLCAIFVTPPSGNFRWICFCTEYWQQHKGCYHEQVSRPLTKEENKGAFMWFLFSQVVSLSKQVEAVFHRTFLHFLQLHCSLLAEPLRLLLIDLLCLLLPEKRKSLVSSVFALKSSRWVLLSQSIHQCRSVDGLLTVLEWLFSMNNMLPGSEAVFACVRLRWWVKVAELHCMGPGHIWVREQGCRKQAASFSGGFYSPAFWFFRVQLL